MEYGEEEEVTVVDSSPALVVSVLFAAAVTAVATVVAVVVPVTLLSEADAECILAGFSCCAAVLASELATDAVGLEVVLKKKQYRKTMNQLATSSVTKKRKGNNNNTYDEGTISRSLSRNSCSAFLRVVLLDVVVALLVTL